MIGIRKTLHGVGTYERYRHVPTLCWRVVTHDLEVGGHVVLDDVVASAAAEGEDELKQIMRIHVYLRRGLYSRDYSRQR